MVLLPFTASAQVQGFTRQSAIPAICGPADFMLEKTKEMGWGADPIFTGISDHDPSIATQIFVDKETGKFTVINWYSRPNIVCVFSNGSDYVFRPLEDKDPEH
jgi:hypothetical protein